MGIILTSRIGGKSDSVSICLLHIQSIGRKQYFIVVS